MLTHGHVRILKAYSAHTIAMLDGLTFKDRRSGRQNRRKRPGPQRRAHKKPDFSHTVADKNSKMCTCYLHSNISPRVQRPSLGPTPYGPATSPMHGMHEFGLNCEFNSRFPIELRIPRFKRDSGLNSQRFKIFALGAVHRDPFTIAPNFLGEGTRNRPEGAEAPNSME